jgi:hypothetical protein
VAAWRLKPVKDINPAITATVNLFMRCSSIQKGINQGFMKRYSYGI